MSRRSSLHVTETVRLGKKAWIPGRKNSRLAGGSIKLPHLFRFFSEMLRAIMFRSAGADIFSRYGIVIIGRVPVLFQGSPDT